MTDQADALRHYPTPGARRADFVIHVIGLFLAVLGGAVMLSLSSGGEVGQILAIAVYASGLILMLSFSMAYNFGIDRYRPFLRRLDHIGIFLMIAGSYTPFTTLCLRGGWAWGMTIAVWTIAGAGILGKLVTPRLPESVWIAIYLGLGWIVVVAIRPISETLSTPAIVLLVIGGLVYTAGVVFYATARFAFWRSIWHGHVVAAACVHWAAILIGTVLPVTR